MVYPRKAEAKVEKTLTEREKWVVGVEVLFSE